MKVDATNPVHYRLGEIEPWDYIIANHLSFLEGNIVKYITRWKYKNGIEDLRKAKVYLDKLIEVEQKDFDASGWNVIKKNNKTKRQITKKYYREK